MFTLIAVLAQLRLENIGLIDSLELNFESGFTVFTGETGAGKSIFLDAIDLLLGGTNISNPSRLLKAGSTNCLIEGSFTRDLLINDWLSENNFQFHENMILVTREWKLTDQKWKSRSKLNGHIINKQQLLSLKFLLVDLTIQGQANKLNHINSQLEWIDRIGSNEIREALSKVKNSWNSWQKSYRKLQSAKNQYEETQRNYTAKLQILKELEMSQINDPDEDQQLKYEEDRLVHVVNIQDSLHLLFNQIKESSSDMPCALDLLSVGLKELKAITDLDQSLSPNLDNMLDIFANLQQLISDLEHYYLLLESDPNRLEIVQQRRSHLKNLQSKYHLDLPELIGKRNQLKAILDTSKPNSDILDLEKNEKLAKAELDKNNNHLTQLRQKFATELEIKLLNNFQNLGLSNSSFKVVISPCSPTQTGADQVMFLFSANPGQPLSPLSEIASGGELSRFLLALKAIQVDVESLGTLIFDEIDTGVSGKVSSSIAYLLKDISRQRQVFCVTHQPLVAAVADHHFSISKTSLDGETSSKVFELKGFEERKHELAQLAGGDFVEASIYAASLLEKKAA